MSPDTKAIVERLQAEGLLLRNSGTNSIKSVKVELGKFTDAFKAMSGSMEGITGTIQGQTKLQELQDERQFKLDQLEEKDKKEYLAQEAVNTKNKQKLDSAKLAQDLKASKERDQKDFKVFGKDGIFASTLKSTFDIVKKTLFFGIVGAIGYEVLAGAVEAIAPKYFGKDVNMPTLFEGFSNAGTALSKISMTDWDGFVDNIKYLAQPIAQLGLGYAAVAGTTAVVKGGANVAAQALTFKALRNMFSPGVDDVGAGMTKVGLTKKLVRGGIAGLVFSGLFAAIEPISNYIRGEAENLTPQQIAQTKVPTSYKIGGLAAASTIGALFLPGGALVMAAGGIAAFLVGGALMLIDHYQDKDMLPNAMENVAQSVINTTNQMDELMQTRQQLVDLDANTEDIDRRIAELKKKIAEDRKNFRENFLESLAEEQEQINQDVAKSDYLKSDKGREEFFDRNSIMTTSTPYGAVYTDVPYEQVEKMYIAKLTELKENIGLNRSQMKATREFGEQEMEYTLADMGLSTYGGVLQTIDQAKISKAAFEKRRADKFEADKFEAYKIYDPSASKYRTPQEMKLASLLELSMANLLGDQGPSNYVVKQGDTTNNYRTVVGGSRNATQQYNNYNSGSLDGNVFVAAGAVN